MRIFSLCIIILSLYACSTPQPIEPSPTTLSPNLAKPQPYTTPTGVLITPYDLEPIQYHTP